MFFTGDAEEAFFSPMLSAANAANITQPPNQEPSERYHYDVETAGARLATNTAGGEQEGKAPLALVRSDGLSSVAL